MQSSVGTPSVMRTSTFLPPACSGAAGVYGFELAVAARQRRVRRRSVLGHAGEAHVEGASGAPRRPARSDTSALEGYGPLPVVGSFVSENTMSPAPMPVSPDDAIWAKIDCERGDDGGPLVVLVHAARAVEHEEQVDRLPLGLRRGRRAAGAAQRRARGDARVVAAERHPARRAVVAAGAVVPAAARRRRRRTNLLRAPAARHRRRPSRRGEKSDGTQTKDKTHRQAHPATHLWPGPAHLATGKRGARYRAASEPRRCTPRTRVTTADPRPPRRRRRCARSPRGRRRPGCPGRAAGLPSAARRGRARPRAPRRRRGSARGASAGRGPPRPSGSRSPGRCRTFATTCSSLRAEMLPMLTWSSRPALDGIESTLAGWQRTLFSLTSDALATCAIMKPECRPLPGARNGVSPVESAGLTSCSTRRSLMFASSATAIAARSSASASGWPWKLPPLMMSAPAVVAQEDARVVGDGVELALEHRAHPRQRVARRAVHLRHAAQGVRVLHLAAVAVALHDLALGEQRAQVAARRRPGPGAGAPRGAARRRGGSSP